MSKIQNKKTRMATNFKMSKIHNDCGSSAELTCHAIQTLPKCAACHHTREAKHGAFQSWDPKDAADSPEEWLLPYFDGPIKRKAALQAAAAAAAAASSSSMRRKTKRAKV